MALTHNDLKAIGEGIWMGLAIAVIALAALAWIAAHDPFLRYPVG